MQSITGKQKRVALFTVLTVALLALVITGRAVLAQGGTAEDNEEAVSTGASPMHPTFPLLDADGTNVLESGNPVSTMETCGACHDTTFIAEHSFHADVGLAAFGEPGSVEGGRPWDSSPGLFGKWNPLTYRYLSPEGDARIDLTTAEWIQFMGARHAGGGPAVYSREGTLLETMGAGSGVEGSIVDPETGELKPWDWQTSGVVEMNCFLCHTPTPNNEARKEALEAGAFAWANSATLAGSGIIEETKDGWQWQEAAFDENGELLEAYVTVQDPRNDNCAQCHGVVHSDAQVPLTLDEFSADEWRTFTTGQIVSPQRLANSGLNLADKEDLTRSWDVHAERVVECTDCHYALNNPVYYQEADQPAHLTFDPRRLEMGEYLYRPLHQFAKGQSAQGTLAPELDNTLRRCESCHSIEATHDWLPYKERHTTVLSCESCHIPKMYAPAVQSMDWTVLQADGSAADSYRGIDLGADGVYDNSDLITGFQPVLLPTANEDGSTSLAPHNLVASWYWVYGEPARPVPLRDLQAAWLDGTEGYAPAVLEAFDADNSGELDEAELVIDSEAKEAVVGARLEALGLENPRIQGEVQPYSINHDVAYGEWAVKECSECHSETSRVTAPMMLSGQIPGGVMPVLISDTSTSLRGELEQTDEGALYYQPSTKSEADSALASLYVLGHDSEWWVDLGGSIIFLLTLGGVAVHGGLRYFSARRREPEEPELREVYMYGVYERLWHWLQTLVIFGLLFTGLIIHRPDTFGIFSFRYVVEVHNVLAAILVINAALSAFYHLASGEIQQFLPRPRGFFDQAFEQAKFYLQGIFRNDPHPFEKTRERKLNPLQQITYFGLLNVLLPLQVITGILMWGVQRWPQAALSMGGLPGLAPFHTLVAWLLATFVVMHVYLTTTGHTATANIRAMIMGWDEVEVHTPEAETRPMEAD